MKSAPIEGEGEREMSHENGQVRRLAGSLGAEITGLDLNEIAAGPLTSKTKRKVHTKATKVTLSTILFVIQISERQRG